MDSLSLQGRTGIPLVFLFKGNKLLTVKLSGCQKKEMLNEAAFLHVCIALKLTIIICAYLHRTTKAKALFLSG